MAEQKPLPQKTEQKTIPTKSIVKNVLARPLKPMPTQLPQKLEQKIKAPEPQKTVKPETPQNPPKQDPTFLKQLKEKQLQQRLSDLQELSIAIDSFEDIFSDFDPREYTKRDISEDLLNALQRRFKEAKTGKFEVIFHAPKIIHDEAKEKIIVQRIKTHFRHIANQNKKDIHTIRSRGLIYVGLGLIILAVFTFATYHQWIADLNLQIIGVLFVPLGWFGVWEGFSKIIDVPWKLTDKLHFNLKMSKANYQFKFLQ